MNDARLFQVSTSVTGMNLASSVMLTMAFNGSGDEVKSQFLKVCEETWEEMKRVYDVQTPEMN